jgi:hypothetical protein
VSVDTSLRGKDTTRYLRVEIEDVRVLVAPSMNRVVDPVRIGTRGAAFWRGFDVVIEHSHGPTCAH